MLTIMDSDLVIRTLVAEDWPEVSRIYAEGIATGNATFERVLPTWEQWDVAHLSAVRLVAVRDREIVGWAALSAVSRRRVYAGVAEVSVYVASQARGQGIGRRLLGHVIQAAEFAGIWTLQGSIFPENTASLRLCEAHGFRRVGKRERIGKVDGNWRDTVLIERRSALVGK
jgi:L-amino acid N-acyltransferase YncA